MTTVDYIYDFLHDPDKHRWPTPITDYLLVRAKEEIRTRSEAFLKLRDINREKAQLKQLGTHDETVTIQLQEGIDVYDLPEDFLRISSVIYEGCFIPHLISSCDNEVECGETDPSKIVRSYNTSGLPKGKIKISPTPKKWTKECVTTECVTVDVMNQDALYGWGLAHIDPKIVITNEEHETVTKTELTLGKMQVTYEVANKLTFVDNSAEVLDATINDSQLLKYYVCGHLLRDDRDSNSRSLGLEELKLFEERINMIFSTYTELYDVDNTLELASADEGYVDTKVNESVINKDSVDIHRGKLEELKDTQDARNNRRAKFDILGTR